MAAVPFQTARQLGAAVRAARERAGLSQRELAARAGVERQWLVLLETGRVANPMLGNVFKTLAALELQLEVAPASVRAQGTPTLDELMG